MRCVIINDNILLYPVHPTSHKHCKELLGKSLIFATKYIEVCD